MKNQTLDFDRQVQGFALQLIGALSALSPVIIILAMLGAFAWLGYMDFLYFSSALPSGGLAILAAVFLQSMRFGTALGSVRMFKAGKIAGILFLGASLTLTYLESGHVIEQAATLATTSTAIKANVYLIKLAVWASVGLELLVAILFSAMFAELDQAEPDLDRRREPISYPHRAEADQRSRIFTPRVLDTILDLSSRGLITKADIDLARAWIDSGLSDAQIVSGLTARAEASQQAIKPASKAEIDRQLAEAEALVSEAIDQFNSGNEPSAIGELVSNTEHVSGNGQAGRKGRPRKSPL